MTPFAFQTIGTVVSVLAVTLSLIGLAWQVRQQNKALRSQNYARALDRVASIQARLSADGSLANLFARGVRDTSQLTPEERIQLTWALLEIFGSFEFMYDQSRAGALPPEVWDRWEITLAWWISLPGVQSWWRANPTVFTPDYTELVEGLIAEPRVDRAAAMRWQRFLQNPYDAEAVAAAAEGAAVDASALSAGGASPGARDERS